MRAATNGHDSCLGSIPESGAEVNPVDAKPLPAVRWLLNMNGCNTALMRAAESGHVKCTEILLNAGAHVNMKNTDDKTPLFRGSREWSY